MRHVGVDSEEAPWLKRLLIPLFPTDQAGSRFQTARGTIHVVLAIAIFASIAVAASNLGGTLGHEAAWSSVKGLVDGWLPWVITGAAIATGIAIAGPRLERIFGLIERLYYLSSSHGSSWCRSS